jgi:hypothetical protein
MTDYSELLPTNTYKSKDIKSDDLVVNPVLVVVPSVIQVEIGYRSNFLSEEDRYNQTIKQLQTIKHKIPEATIILLETSKNLSSLQIITLSNLCDYQILYNDNEKILNKSHTPSINKGMGELNVLEHICGLIKTKHITHFCKFGGRYSINDSFNKTEFLCDIPVVCATPGNGRHKIVAQTVLYSVPQDYFEQYYYIMKNWTEIRTYLSAEDIFTLFLDTVPNIKVLDKIGVTGVGSMTGIVNIL